VARLPMSTRCEQHRLPACRDCARHHRGVRHCCLRHHKAPRTPPSKPPAAKRVRRAPTGALRRLGQPQQDGQPRGLRPPPLSPPLAKRQRRAPPGQAGDPLRPRALAWPADRGLQPDADPLPPQVEGGRAGTERPSDPSPPGPLGAGLGEGGRRRREVRCPHPEGRTAPDEDAAPSHACDATGSRAPPTGRGGTTS